MKNTNTLPKPTLAARITKAASKQTYFTIRFLVDRQRVNDAYHAYAYFRWVDDCLDAETGSRYARIAFANRQQSLLEACYRGEPPGNLCTEEQLLVELVRSDGEKNNGLHSYLSNMMAVMAFDAERRGKIISQAELDGYTHYLASAVTEAMHYFIGHNCYSPKDETRYLAVTAAHITHMLRDTFDDLQAGYYNIPREVLETNQITPHDVQSDAYREWVHGRIQLARAYFKAGREYLDQVENLRCRLAGYAYAARFEMVLEMIEKENYYLRSQYNERRSLRAGMHTGWSALSSLVNHNGQNIAPRKIVRPRSLVKS